MMVRVVLCLLGSVMLSACGGGGGGGGGEGGGGSTSFTIQLQQSNVSLQYREGGNLTSTDIVATWRGTPPNPLYVRATVEGLGIAAPAISINDVQARATITASRQPAGEYTGRIVFLACSDQNCNSPVGGTPLNVPYTVRVTPAAFTVEGVGAASQINVTHLLGLTAPTRTLNIAAGAGAWTATTSASWITLSQASGTGAAGLVMSVRPELLTTQRTEATVTVSTSGLGTQTLDVAMIMRAPSVQSTPGFAIFNGVAGAPLSGSQQNAVQLESGASLPMTVSANQPWLRLSSAATTAPGSFVVSLDPSASALPGGTHRGTVNVHLEGGVTDIERSIEVVLSLEQASISAPTNIVLGGESGRDFSTAPLTFSLNTGSNAYPWTVTSPPAWLEIDRSSGAFGQSGDTLTLRPRYEQSSPGQVTHTLQLSTSVNGEVITRPVTVQFGLDVRRLIAAETGIAFTDLPGAARDELTRTIKVRDNYNQNVNWEADDDASWLTVTSSGTHDGDLVVSADTTGLAADQLYTARVRISTDESAIQDDEYIHVGLWVGTSMPTANRQLYGRYWDMTGDPIRPYVYAREIAEGMIRVFNVYTGAQIATINGIPDTTVHLAVSKDGQTLYALASNNVVPVNLNTYAVGSTIQLPFNYEVRQRLSYARPNGVGVLLDNRGGAFLAADGTPLGGGATGEFGLSGDSRWIFWADSRWSLDFTQSRGFEDLLMRRAGELVAGDDASARFAASNFDASRVYMMRYGNSGVRRFIVFNGLTLDSIVELETPQNASDVVVARHGHAVFSKPVYGNDDITIYNPDHTVALSGIDLGDSGHDLSVSGDGNFALVSSYSILTIVPIPR